MYSLSVLNSKLEQQKNKTIIQFKQLVLLPSELIWALNNSIRYRLVYCIQCVCVCVFIFNLLYRKILSVSGKKKQLLSFEKPVCVKSIQLLLFVQEAECVEFNSFYFFILKCGQRHLFCCCCQTNKGQDRRNVHLCNCFCEMRFFSVNVSR